MTVAIRVLTSEIYFRNSSVLSGIICILSFVVILVYGGVRERRFCSSTFYPIEP